MLKYDPIGNILHIDSRTLALFAHPSGDIEVKAGYAVRRTPQGIEATKKLRQEHKDRCESNVIITDNVTFNSREYSVTVDIDNIIHEATGITVELVEETGGTSDFGAISEHPAKEAELQIGAFFVSLKSGKCPVTVRLTRVNYFTGNVCSCEQALTFSELEDKMRAVISSAAPVLEYAVKAKTEGIASAAEVHFPYTEIRDGQRDFINEAYKTIKKGKRLLVNAPTGIGKTAAAIYPALKAMKKCSSERIFYLTSKGTAAKAALSALSLFSKNELKVKSIGLSAKERLCANLHGKDLPHACRSDECKYAKGHYARSRDALLALLSLSVITPEEILKVAEKYTVCPYELSLDASLFCSVIVCDYNYLFDPSAYLRRYFPGISNENIFLIDEAHNLPDRVRDMYTCEFSSKLLTCILTENSIEFYQSLKLKLQSAVAVMNKMRALCNENTHVDQNGVEYGACTQNAEIPEFTDALEKLQFECDKLLPHPEQLQSSMYLKLVRLQKQIRDYLLCNVEYASGSVYTVMFKAEETKIAVRCIDPAEIINNKLSFAASSVLFSATLEPIDYFAQITGCSDATSLSLPSPYEKDNLCVAIMDKISTRYEDRKHTLHDVARAILTVLKEQKGNYFVFSPSYEYSEQLYKICRQNISDVNILLQRKQMTYEDRRKFLCEFEKAEQQTVGFCVMGGIFSESVDLPGDKLIGCIIIGNGIGAITAERNLFCEYYQNKYESGYEYAYVYPGMNRVLQAAGRVIRSERDKGIVLLIDDRYATPEYRRLMPEHWHSLKYVGNTASLSVLLRSFWKKF